MYPQGIYYLCGKFGNGKHIIEEGRLWPSYSSIGSLGHCFTSPFHFSLHHLELYLVHVLIDYLIEVSPHKVPYVRMLFLCCNLSLQEEGKY